MKSAFRKAVIALTAAAGAWVITPDAHAGTLIGYYKLNGNFNDSSGQGNNGVAGPDSPTFGAGVNGLGAVFSGTDPLQLFTIPINLNNLNQVTFGAWIHVSDNSSLRGIISNDTGGYGRTIGIDFRGSGTEGYSAFNNGSAFGGVPPSANGFDFVAVVYDRIAGSAMLDVNGTLISSTGVAPFGDSFITVGRNPHYDDPFAGTIDNLFIYNGALTSNQLGQIQAHGIHANKCVETPPPAPDVVPLPAAFWPGMTLLMSLGGMHMLRRKRPAFA